MDFVVIKELFTMCDLRDFYTYICFIFQRLADTFEAYEQLLQLVVKNLKLAAEHYKKNSLNVDTDMLKLAQTALNNEKELKDVLKVIPGTMDFEIDLLKKDVKKVWTRVKCKKFQLKTKCSHCHLQKHSKNSSITSFK